MTEIALIGNPNSGKTSLFNLITGHNQRVGNWPGVTVERKSGLVKKNKDLEIQDLPGIYSMSPYSPEEKVARDYLLSQRADSILNVVDATNLERNLYLTTQLIETGCRNGPGWRRSSWRRSTCRTAGDRCACPCWARSRCARHQTWPCGRRRGP